MKIYEQGLESHPIGTAIFGNFMMLLWIASGTLACWFLNPLIGWIYLAFALIMVYFVLRKIVCTNCYYYGKMCPIGWGKWTALFFKKGDIEKFSSNIGVKLAPAVYGILSLIPLVFVVISMIQHFSISKLLVLIVILLISFYSGSISRAKSCINCKMRLMCPGCAIKEKKTQ